MTKSELGTSAKRGRRDGFLCECQIASGRVRTAGGRAATRPTSLNANAVANTKTCGASFFLSLHAVTLLAEGEGFEPPGPCGPLVFKTSAIDHSATPPAR